MNKKIRLLSFFMALAMILGVVAILPMIVRAEDTEKFDYRSSFSGYSNAYFNYSSIDLRAFIETSPVINGVIGQNEYNVTRTAKGANSFNVQANGADYDVNQYFAQDNENVYLAFVIPDFKKDSELSLCLWPQQVFDTADASYFNALKFTIKEGESLYVWGTKSVNDNVAGVFSSIFGADKTYMSADVAKLVTTTADQGATYTATVEFKFAKADLAKAAGIALEDLINFRYNVQYTNTANDSNRGIFWAFANNGSAEAVIKACSPELEASFKTIENGEITDSYNHWTKLGISVNLRDDIYSADLGSIRFTYDAPENSGLRFQTTVRKGLISDYKADGYTVEAGTLIAPADYVGKGKQLGETLTIDDADVALNVVADLSKPFARGVNTITFTGAIVDIKVTNYARDFIAVGYLKLTKGGEVTYIYSNPVTKNVHDIAKAALDSGKYAVGSVDYNYLYPIATFDPTAVTDPWGNDVFPKQS